MPILAIAMSVDKDLTLRSPIQDIDIEGESPLSDVEELWREIKDRTEKINKRLVRREENTFSSLLELCNELEAHGVSYAEMCSILRQSRKGNMHAPDWGTTARLVSQVKKHGEVVLLVREEEVHYISARESTQHIPASHTPNGKRKVKVSKPSYVKGSRVVDTRERTSL